MSSKQTITGGREAAGGVIPGQWALSVGNPLDRINPRFTWQLLSEVARLESGHTPSRKVASYWGGDIPWVGVRDATRNHGRVITETRETVTEEGIANSSARVLPQETVCLSRTASVGFVIMMGRPMATSQDFVNWVCGPKLNPYYLKYIFTLEQGSIRRFAHGTTHQTMYYPEAKALHVLLPARREQDRIADVLGTLDDLIETNQCVAIGLESLAQSLFDRLMSNSAASAGVTPLSSTVEILSGGTPKTSEPSYWGGGIPWFSVVDTPNDHEVWVFETSKSITEEGLAHSPARLLPIGSTILSARGTVGKTALVATPMAMNQSCYALRSLNGPRGFYNYFLTRSVVEELQQNAHGSVFDTITRATLDGVMVPDLASGQIIAFEDSVAPLLDQVLALLQENQKLAMARDELLPLLLSGRVSVREVAA
jgi:type I restriction enzyme S subunit